MAVYFPALNLEEQRAVSDHVRTLYTTLRVRQPETRVRQTADQWCDEMCEVIARDPKRVRAIVEKAAREEGSAGSVP